MNAAAVVVWQIYFLLRVEVSLGKTLNSTFLTDCLSWRKGECYLNYNSPFIGLGKHHQSLGVESCNAIFELGFCLVFLSKSETSLFFL